jgi:hypothetical protein
MRDEDWDGVGSLLPPGASAEARAAALRTRDESLEKGARGERHTGALLEPLRALGYVVLHDLAMPRSRANVDHVVIGPTGLFVIDSKYWRSGGQVRAWQGQLFSGPHYKGDEAHRLAWMVRTVRKESALDRFADLPTRAVMCIHVAPFEADTLEVEGATVVHPRALVRAITAHPESVTPDTVRLVATAVMSAFRPKLGGPWPDLDAPSPSPAAEAAPTPSAVPRATRRPTVMTSSLPAPAPRPVASARPQVAPLAKERGGTAKGLDRDLARLVAITAAVIAAIVLVPLLARLVTRSGASAPSSPAAAAGTRSTPAHPAGQFACFAPGHGWSYELTNDDSKSVEWAVSPDGPWTPVLAAEGMSAKLHVLLRTGDAQWAGRTPDNPC